jgi:hypothetical protein
MNPEIENINEEIEDVIEWQQLRDFENYDIATNHPFQIRERSTSRIIAITFDAGADGYNRVWLNGKHYLHHRIIAQQFIENPENLPQIDHINRVKTDNRLENLRWISNSENQKNKASHDGIIYEFINELPEDAIVVENYNNHDFTDLYYSHSLRRFIFNNGVNYRLLYNRLKIHTYFVEVVDTQNRRLNIYLNKYQRLCGFE